MYSNRVIFSKIRVLFVYFQKRQRKPPTLPLSGGTPKLIYFLKRSWYSTNCFFHENVQIQQKFTFDIKKPSFTWSSCHIGVIYNDRNRCRMWAYQKNSPCSCRKIITFSHLNSTNANVNFMREKVKSTLVVLIL